MASGWGSFGLPHRNQNATKKIIPGPFTEKLVNSRIEDSEKVCNLINETMPDLEIEEVYTVKNSFLEAMYLLKKEEYKSRNGKAPEEKLLFHVTAASNVKSIISDNFDWRRISRGLFGLGTSFSGDAEYADCYANYNIGDERAIIVTKVLVYKSTSGHSRMKVPPQKSDTATGNNNKVYVKFSDNEMLPKYIIYYNPTFSHKKEKAKGTKKKSYQKTRRTGYYEKEEYEEEYGDEYFEDENSTFSHKNKKKPIKKKSNQKTLHTGYYKTEEYGDEYFEDEEYECHDYYGYY